MNEGYSENPTHHVQWLLPDLEREMGEIERTAKTLAPEDAEAMQVRIIEALNDGEAIDLTDDIWARMENTDSWDIRPGHEEDVRYHTDHSGRDAVKFERAMRTSGPIHMPIIVIKEDGTPYKVAGNTRLMVSRELGITPKVFVAYL